MVELRPAAGKAQLHESFRVVAERGCNRVLLGVDAASLTGAQVLYESVGMPVAATFDLYERLS